MVLRMGCIDVSVGRNGWGKWGQQDLWVIYQEDIPFMSLPNRTQFCTIFRFRVPYPTPLSYCFHYPNTA